MLRYWINFLLLFCVSTLFAQEKLLLEGIQSFKDQKYSQATQELRRYYQNASEKDENIPVCLEYLGLSYYYLGKHDSASFFLEKEYLMISDVTTKKELAVLIATSYFILQNYPISDSYYQIYFAQNPPKNDDEAYLYNYWALSNYYQAKYEISRAKSEDILKYLKKEKKQHTLFYYQVLNNIGLAYFDETNYTEAEKYYLQVLDFHEKNPEHLTDFATALNNISMLYSTIGKYELAKERLQKVEKFYAKEYGKQHENYALILLNLASIELAKGMKNPEEIEKTLLQAFDIVKDKNVLLYGQIAYHLAWFYRDTYNTKKAEKYFLETQDFFYKNQLYSHEYYISSLVNLGTIYSQTQEYQKAHQYLDVVIAYQEQIQYLNQNYIQVVNAKGMVCRDESKLKEAVIWFKKGIDACEKGNQITFFLYPLLLNNLGLTYSELNEANLAEKCFLKSIELYEKHEYADETSFATALSNLGTVYLAKEDYPKAEIMFRKALQKFRDNHQTNHVNYALALNNIGLVKLNIGANKEAVEIFTEVLSFYEKNQIKNVEYALVVNNLGLAYYDLADYQNAEKYFTKAYQLFHELNQTNNINYALMINNSAQMYQVKGNYFKAKMMFYEAKKLKEETYKNYEQDFQYILMLNNIGLSHYSLEEYKMAENQYNTAVSLLKKHFSKDVELYATINYNLAMLYEKTNQLEKATVAFQEVINNKLFNIERNFSTFNDKERELYIEKNQPYFDGFRNFYCRKLGLTQAYSQKINSTDLGDLYNLQLQTKGVLLNNYQRFKTKILQSNDSLLVKKYNTFLSKKEEIARYASYSSTQLAEQGIDMNVLLKEVNQLEKELMYQSKDFESLYKNTKVTWQMIQKKLQDNEVAIEMLHLDEAYGGFYVALIISKKMTTPFAVCLSDSLDKEKYAFYRNTMIYALSDTLSYYNYWKPIAQMIDKYAPSTTKIYFSPEGVYNNLNLNTLYNPQTKQYLLFEKDIYLVTKTKDLLVENVNRPAKKAFLFGNPSFLLQNKKKETGDGKRSYAQNMQFDLLPATEIEVNEIEKVLQQRKWFVNAYLGESAQEQNVKKMQNPNLLHFSTHGLFIQDSSFSTTDMMLNSGIVLAGIENYFSENEDDGLLTAYEVMNMNLDSTELVVLSACETGLGKVSKGEGVYGLQRAFKVAGAHQIIMSLWKVDDKATQLLMGYFYEEWLGNRLSVHAALKKAQEKLQQNQQYKHPYYWGAFQIIE